MIKNLLNVLLTSDTVIDNEYFNNYCKLIESNMTTKKEKYVTNVHHIVPRSYYKTNNMVVDDSKDNLVNLSYKDHILAHYYLYMCSNSASFKMSNAYATYLMLNEYSSALNSDYDNLILTLDHIQELYSSMRKDLSRVVSKKLMGHSVSDSTKNKISKSNKNRYFGHIWVSKDGVTKHISKDEIDTYISCGYSVGRNDFEAFAKISEAQKRNPNRSMLGRSQSEYQKSVVREYMKNRTVTNDTKLNMSLARKGKVLISNDITQHSFYVEKELVSDYLKNNYHLGRLKK